MFVTNNLYNSRLLSKITGNSVRQEARSPLFCVVQWARVKRAKWLGHILRLPDARIVKIAVRVQYEMGLPGNICADAPQTSSFEQLVRIASDRRIWDSHCPRAPKMRPGNTTRPTRTTTTTAPQCNDHRYPTRSRTRDGRATITTANKSKSKKQPATESLTKKYRTRLLR